MRGRMLLRDLDRRRDGDRRALTVADTEHGDTRRRAVDDEGRERCLGLVAGAIAGARLQSVIALRQRRDPRGTKERGGVVSTFEPAPAIRAERRRRKHRIVHNDLDRRDTGEAIAGSHPCHAILT